MGKEGKRGRSSCAAAGALELIGDRWSLLIVRAYIFGDCREYSNFLEIPEGISTNILANRLSWLVEIGIFTKHCHPTNRKKFYYDITDRGLDLIPVIMELARWGWTHLPGMWTPPEIKRSYTDNREAFEAEWKRSVRATTERYLQSAKSAIQSFPIQRSR